MESRKRTSTNHTKFYNQSTQNTGRRLPRTQNRRNPQNRRPRQRNPAKNRKTQKNTRHQKQARLHNRVTGGKKMKKTEYEKKDGSKGVKYALEAGFLCLGLLFCGFLLF